MPKKPIERAGQRKIVRTSYTYPIGSAQVVVAKVPVYDGTIDGEAEIRASLPRQGDGVREDEYYVVRETAKIQFLVHLKSEYDKNTGKYSYFRAAQTLQKKAELYGFSYCFHWSGDENDADKARWLSRCDSAALWALTDEAKGYLRSKVGIWIEEICIKKNAISSGSSGHSRKIPMKKRVYNEVGTEIAPPKPVI